MSKSFFIGVALVGAMMTHQVDRVHANEWSAQAEAMASNFKTHCDTAGYYLGALAGAISRGNAVELNQTIYIAVQNACPLARPE